MTLEVARGEIHAICGENGAGKSTLMKVLSGVYPHGTYDGRHRLRRTRSSSSATSATARPTGIVIIHQELALSPYLSIAENIFLGNEVSGQRGLIDWNKTNHEAAELLARVGLDENPAPAIIDIGVGKQQLVEIAKALSKEVKLLILDEPTAALNDEDSDHLLDLIRTSRRRASRRIIICHKLNEIEKIADSVTVIRDGKTIETLDMPTRTSPRTASSRAWSAASSSTASPTTTPHIGDEVLRVEDWTVHHPQDHDASRGRQASTSTCARGEIVGIAGPHGRRPHRARDELFGRSYGTRHHGQGLQERRGDPDPHGRRGDPQRHRLRHRGPQDLRPQPHRGHQAQHLDGRRSASSSSRGSSTTTRSTRSPNEYRASMNIKAPVGARQVAASSRGGNQQKVVLSKWIFTDPDVLILDEPTRGIDVGAKYEIYTIINRLAAEGRAIIVISSELPELLGICDRIYALSEGRITGECPRRGHPGSPHASS